MQAATVAGSDFSINSNKIDKNLKIFMEVDLLNSCVRNSKMGFSTCYNAYN